MNEQIIEYKMNRVTYDILLKAYSYLLDGRAFLAREKLEEVFVIDADKKV